MANAIYDIPRTVEYDPAFKLIVDYTQILMEGDVDYGPHYWCEYTVEFTEDVTPATVAKVFGDYLAYNYRDNFRQAEVISGSNREWVVHIHIAWGNGHYTPVTP